MKISRSDTEIIAFLLDIGYDDVTSLRSIGYDLKEVITDARASVDGELTLNDIFECVVQKANIELVRVLKREKENILLNLEEEMETSVQNYVAELYDCTVEEADERSLDYSDVEAEPDYRELAEAYGFFSDEALKLLEEEGLKLLFNYSASEVTLKKEPLFRKYLSDFTLIETHIGFSSIEEDEEE